MHKLIYIQASADFVRCTVVKNLHTPDRYNNIILLSIFKYVTFRANFSFDGETQVGHPLYHHRTYVVSFEDSDSDIYKLHFEG